MAPAPALQSVSPDSVGSWPGEVLAIVVTLSALVYPVLLDVARLILRLCVRKAGQADVESSLENARQLLLELYDTCKSLATDEASAHPARSCGGPTEQLPDLPAAIAAEADAVRPPAIHIDPGHGTFSHGANQQQPDTDDGGAAAAIEDCAGVEGASQVGAAGGLPALAQGGRLQSFQLRDEDLFGVSVSGNCIPFPDGSNADGGGEGSEVLGEFPVPRSDTKATGDQGPGPRSDTEPPGDQGPIRTAPNGNVHVHLLPALVMPPPLPAGTAPSSDYGTPRSQQGSDASFYTTSDYSDLLLSPRSDAAGPGAKWVPAHPLSALNQAVSECDEEVPADSEADGGLDATEEVAANGDVENGRMDTVKARKRRGVLPKVLLPRMDDGENGKRQERGLLKRLFGKKGSN